MWKKDEPQGTDRAQDQPARPVPAPPRHDTAPRHSTAMGERATIGRSITIRGDVTGDEDLVIQGRIEGTVDLKLHSVTVGPEGRVKANITGRSVFVEGEVIGDLRGQEHVALRSTARVEGNIVAPKVALDEGAVFRGSIDMADKSDHGTARSTPVSAPGPAPAEKKADTAAKPVPPAGDEKSAAKA